ncbi:TMPIT-like protein [Ancylostoma caninum]|uniref:TMPIT-like protein n=1 Tax=Ancylostoma caninum TaxID=29170 RepID=A0A368H5E4_ANCCA|nr:TMPIT-like protein [Ancylostoma caninum]
MIHCTFILGKNLNLSLLSKNDRYKYKQDYESFKWKVTVAILVSVALSYLFPWRVLDSIGNFLMVWYYCTLTIRESVLTINGSRIKGWWVMHHYLSCVLCGIVLTWRDGECYQSFRHQFLMFVFYLCFVQILQTQYQSGCLRRLHSLGQGHIMDITVEGFTSFMFKGLTFLLPFLVAAYVSIQF